MAETPELLLKEAARFLGIKNNIPPQLEERINELYNILTETATPRSVWRIFQIEAGEVSVTFDDAFSIQGKDLAQILRGCQRAVLLAATLGSSVDKLIGRLQATAMDDAVILNACATAEIEALCRRAEGEILRAIGKDSFLTMRYSPGYGDVPLAESEKIITALCAQKQVGLTLTRTNILVPLKSVTAVIGINKDKREEGGECPGCGLQDSCPFRKRGESCGL